MTEEQLTDSTDASEATSEPANSQHTLTEQKSDKPWLFQPGVSGNPSGRPRKDKTLTGALEGLVDRDELAAKLMKIANDDKTPALQLEAIKYVFARIEGSPIQAMRHQIEGAVGPLIFLHPGKVIEAQSTDVTDSEANTVEGEALDATADEPTQTDESNTRPDPAGPPSV